MFYLAICFWMSYGRLEHTDVVVVAEIQELFTSQLGVIVRDGAVGNPQAVDDVGKKEHSLLRPDAGDRMGLDPLRKFVNGNEQVGETASCPFQGSDEVDPQTANDHVMGMVCRAWARRWVCLA
jgi:hypothetical protein